jgi:hypothetical protein
LEAVARPKKIRRPEAVARLAMVGRSEAVERLEKVRRSEAVARLGRTECEPIGRPTRLKHNITLFTDSKYPRIFIFQRLGLEGTPV